MQRTRPRRSRIERRFVQLNRRGYAYGITGVEGGKSEEET